MLEKIYIHTKRKRNIINDSNKKVKVCFYYFTKDKKKPPDTIDWQRNYSYFRILQLTDNHQHITLDVDSDKERSIHEGNVRNRGDPIIVNVIGNYFNSYEAKKLFNCRADESVEHCLSRRIGKFDEILNNREGISTIVNRGNEEDCKLSEYHLMLCFQRIQYLRTAYHIVLENKGRGNSSFIRCCKDSIDRCKSSGLTLINNPNILMKWNRFFRINEIFPHPNNYIEMGRKYHSPFLDSFPEAKLSLRDWANDNLDILSCQAVSIQLQQNIIPNIFNSLPDDLQAEGLTYKNFLNHYGLKSITSQTAWRWMKLIGFHFDKRKKCYFSDHHEDMGNVEYRKIFIQKYFKYELNTYRWVHISEDFAKNLEQEKDNPLLENIFIEFKRGNIKMREYHVDTHTTFENLTLNLSVRRDTGRRPIMMIGQDESVFRQYSFGSKCWVGPSGEIKLLPKSDGYSRMVSAFVSRSFGMGLDLTENEMMRVNERRISDEWGEYISDKESIEVYGFNKKKKIKDTFTLVQFFDIGINEEGYWNYNHMALQVEDIFDVLSTKYIDFDFVFLMDQSSGHGRMRDGSLNINTMNKKWGGKQKTLRKSVLEDVGPFPQRIYNVGDVQEFNFVDEDIGPFDMNGEEQIMRKYDRPTGVSKIVEKNKKELIDLLKEKGFIVKGHYDKDELHRLAERYGISLTHQHDIIEEGWLGKPKGMLQILWERGWIDVTKLDHYSEKGKKNHVDDEGKVKEEYIQYVLHNLMTNCKDFVNEKSAMEVLLEKLSAKDTASIKLLTSPKYHCELAGEGVEYDWGLSKRKYRSIPLHEKKTKKNFEICVRESIRYVKKNMSNILQQNVEDI